MHAVLDFVASWAKPAQVCQIGVSERHLPHYLKHRKHSRQRGAEQKEEKASL